MGLNVVVSSHQDMASQYGKGITFPSPAWGIRPITTHWIAGQSEYTSLLRMMSFVKICAFQKGGAYRSNNNVQYVENSFFFYLKCINTLHYTKYTK